MDKINVLSLFNGMNTGQEALKQCGIPVNKYYSSEIKPAAIKLTQHHYPNTIQLGDINNWENWDIDWAKIDFILSGSPCQDLSIAGKRAGINGQESGLFWVFVEILNHVKKLNPEVFFFQENVGSANKKDIGIISRALGVYPVKINSSLLTAQLRSRYYWTNSKTKKSLFDVVTDISQPKDLNIKFQDILTSGTTNRKKSTTLLERYHGAKYKDFKAKNSQEFMLSRDARGMCPIVNEGKYFRLLNKIELCRLQGFPDNYCDIITWKEAASLLGDGWTLPVIVHIFNEIFSNN